VILNLKYRVASISIVHFSPPAPSFSMLKLTGWKPVDLTL